MEMLSRLARIRGYHSLLAGAVLVFLASVVNSVEWEFVADLADAENISELYLDPVHSRLLLGGSRGYRIYTPLTEEWILREGEATGTVLSFLTEADDSLFLLTGRDSGYFYGLIMDDSGLVTYGEPVHLTGEFGSVTGLGCLPEQGDTLFACAATNGHIFRSLDHGQNWSSVYLLGSVSGTSLAVAPSGDVYVGHGTLGYPYSGNGILCSRDSGETWEDVSGDMPLPYHVGGIAVDPQDSNHIYVRQGSGPDPDAGVYETMDGGEHWEQVLQGDVRDLAMHPTNSSKLVAVVYIGVGEAAIVFTSDGGTHWTNITSELPSVNGSEKCTISPTDERIYVCQVHQGLWATGTDLTSIHESRPSSIKIEAFPNPFNPAATIRFSLSKATEFSLSIVDTSGRVVRSLLPLQFSAAGLYSHTWDGRGRRGERLASGLYFAVVQSTEGRQARKLLLLQ
jgi:hypothetical protein